LAALPGTERNAVAVFLPNTVKVVVFMVNSEPVVNAVPGVTWAILDQSLPESRLMSTPTEVLAITFVFADCIAVPEKLIAECED
jgi:hypothetical protein